MNKRYGISAAVLKWIAVVTMLIDHFAVAVYLHMKIYNYFVYETMRFIGRISFPIYCFLLVEGFFHTRNVKNYIKNCFLFALISEIPFNIAIFGKVFYPQGQNIYFTLVIGLCALCVLDKLRGKYKIRYILLRVVIIILFAYLGEVLEVDYHWKGILYIILFYYCKSLNIWAKNFILVCAFAVYEIAAPLAFIPIALYNGKRGWQIKYLFYAIYPLHLFIFGIIRFYISG